MTVAKRTETAYRQSEAHDQSAWDTYEAAIRAARTGDVKRLALLLRGHRPLLDSDFDPLADYIEATAKRGRGRERNEAVHFAARLAESLLQLYPGKVSDSIREAVISRALEQTAREYIDPVSAEQVRDLLNRPKRRRK